MRRSHSLFIEPVVHTFSVRPFRLTKKENLLEDLHVTLWCAETTKGLSFVKEEQQQLHGCYEVVTLKSLSINKCSLHSWSQLMVLNLSSSCGFFAESVLTAI